MFGQRRERLASSCLFNIVKYHQDHIGSQLDVGLVRLRRPIRRGESSLALHRAPEDSGLFQTSLACSEVRCGLLDRVADLDLLLLTFLKVDAHAAESMSATNRPRLRMRDLET